MSASYDAVHFRLVAARGKASTHDCIGCGEKAKDWAYQHNGDPELEENGLLYSESPECYEPMCRSCHRLVDNLFNPEYVEKLRKSSAVARAALALNHSGKMVEVGERLGAYTARRRKEDPEFDKRLRGASATNIQAAIANPGPPEKVSSDRSNAARVANKIQRKCTDCGLVAHPAAMGAHLKGSHHTGYETL